MGQIRGGGPPPGAASPLPGRRPQRPVVPAIVLPAREDPFHEAPRLVEGDLLHELLEVGGRAVGDPALDPVRPRVVAGAGEERLLEAPPERREKPGPEGEVEGRGPRTRRPALREPRLLPRQ